MSDPGTAQAGAPGHPAVSPAVSPARTLAVLLAAGVTFALSQTLVLPALPALAREYGADRSTTAWVLTGFLLSASVTTPVVGKLGDLYGRGRVLAGVLLIFGAGGLVGALATDVGVLIAGRTLQGVAGGVFPLAYGIARDSLPPECVPGAVSLISAVYGMGAGVGLPLSGVIVDRLDVSWLFWLGLVALPVALASLAWVKPPASADAAGPVDWAGALLLGAALAGLLLGVTQALRWGWASAPTVGLLVLGASLLLVWALVEARRASPLIRLDVLARPAVAATNLTSFLVGVAMISGFLLIPQLAQAPRETGYGLGASATAAGLLLLPSAAGQLIVGPVAGRLGVFAGFRGTLILGAAFMVAAFALLALAHSESWHLMLGGFVLGVGIAFAFASAANLVVDAVRRSEVGVSTGINIVLRTVGGAFGAAASATVLATSGGPPGDSGYTAAFAFSAAAALVATGAALLVPRPRPAPEAGNTGPPSTNDHLP